MSEEKKLSEQLKEKLFACRKNAVYRMNDSEIAECDSFAEDYKKFLDSAKTEREAVETAVKILEENGGKMPNAVGVPEEMLRQAATMAVCKINIDSDIRLACTAMVRKHLNEHPDHFDPRQYLTDARQAVHDMVAHKIKTVLGSENKA